MTVAKAVLAGFAVTLAVVAALWLDTLTAPGVVLAAAAVVGGSAWVMQRETGVFRLHRMTVPGFWYLTYLAMVLIPGVVVWFSEPWQGRDTFLAAILIGALGVPLGVVFVNRLVGFRPAEVDAWYERPIVDEAGPDADRLVIIAGLALGLGLMAMYIIEVPSIPLLYMIRHPGDYETLVLMREDSFKLLDSPFLYAYYVLRTFGFPFLVMVALGSWLRYRDAFWRTTFIVSLVAALLFAGFSTAKAPVAVVVLLVFLFLYLYRRGRLGGRMLVLGGVLLFVFPVVVLLSVSTRAGIDLGFALGAVTRRVFYAPAWTLFWYFVVFPGFEGHLAGRSIGKLSDVMGWRFFDTPNYVGLHGEGSWVSSVNANAAFVGDLWADWGMTGVVLGAVAAGVLMQLLQVHFMRRPKSIAAMAALAYVVFACWLLHSTSLPVVLASNGVAVVPFVPFLMRATGDLLARTLHGGRPPGVPSDSRPR